MRRWWISAGRISMVGAMNAGIIPATASDEDGRGHLLVMHECGAAIPKARLPAVPTATSGRAALQARSTAIRQTDPPRTR
jgi:hypothetical protein